MKIGLRGVQIGSHVNDWNLNAPELFPVFEAAQELGAAIFVHPWDMMAKEKMSKYWLPWLVGMPAETSLAICSMIFGGIFERLKQKTKDRLERMNRIVHARMKDQMNIPQTKGERKRSIEWNQ